MKRVLKLKYTQENNVVVMTMNTSQLTECLKNYYEAYYPRASMSGQKAKLEPKIKGWAIQNNISHLEYKGYVIDCKPNTSNRLDIRSIPPDVKEKASKESISWYFIPWDIGTAQFLKSDAGFEFDPDEEEEEVDYTGLTAQEIFEDVVELIRIKALYRKYNTVCLYEKKRIQEHLGKLDPSKDTKIMSECGKYGMSVQPRTFVRLQRALLPTKVLNEYTKRFSGHSLSLYKLDTVHQIIKEEEESGRKLVKSKIVELGE